MAQLGHNHINAATASNQAGDTGKAYPPILRKQSRGIRFWRWPIRKPGGIYLQKKQPDQVRETLLGYYQCKVRIGPHYGSRRVRYRLTVRFFSTCLLPDGHTMLACSTVLHEPRPK